jgi:hypothetical protein
MKPFVISSRFHHDQNRVSKGNESVKENGVSNIQDIVKSEVEQITYQHIRQVFSSLFIEELHHRLEIESARGNSQIIIHQESLLGLQYKAELEAKYQKVRQDSPPQTRV